MRLYKVVLLVALALAIGVFFSWLWWGLVVKRLRHELTAASRLLIARKMWTAQPSSVYTTSCTLNFMGAILLSG